MTKNKPGLARRGLMRATAALAGASATAAAAAGLARSAEAQTLSLDPQRPPPSPNWARALPPGPDTSVKITEAYAAMVARDAYFWAWPMINIYNRRLAFKDTPEPMLSGPASIAPLISTGINVPADLRSDVGLGSRLIRTSLPHAFPGGPPLMSENRTLPPTRRRTSSASLRCGRAPRPWRNT